MFGGEITSQHFDDVDDEINPSCPIGQEGIFIVCKGKKKGKVCYNYFTVFIN